MFSCDHVTYHELGYRLLLPPDWADHGRDRQASGLASDALRELDEALLVGAHLSQAAAEEREKRQQVLRDRLHIQSSLRVAFGNEKTHR